MRRPWLSGCTIFLLAASSPAAGLEPDSGSTSSPREALEAARGRGALLFEIHCSSCHGSAGRGDGPLAGDLEVAPADLTDLLESDGDGRPAFPAARLRAVIDGRDEIGGHGGREMPVWGLTFQESGRDADQEGLVAGRIDDLIAFLRDLQATDSDAPEDSAAAD